MRALTKGSSNAPLKVLLLPAQPGVAGDQLLPARVVVQAFGYLGHTSWWRVVLWLRRKHPQCNWKQLRARYYLWSGIPDGDITVFNPVSVETTGYRYLGTRIP